MAVAMASAMVCVSAKAAVETRDPKVRAAVQKAAGYLRAQLGANQPTGAHPVGQRSIAAYALIKAGDSPATPLIAGALNDVLRRTSDGEYSPGADGHYGIYTAGAELMLLEAADPVKYRKSMEVIVAYISKHQDSSGAWDYIDQFRGGDTSQCQYALLGCWAAQRAGIEIPLQLWDNCARWLLQTQARDGGFAYHPRGEITSQQVVTHSMTVAAVSCLLVCKQYLYPNDVPVNRNPQNNLKYGVLEKVDLDTAEGTGPTQTNQNYKPTTSLSDIKSGVDRGLGWFTRSYRISGTGIWDLYFLYTVERMAALADVPEIAGHDWYSEGAEHLIKTQNASAGSWNDQSTAVPATAFGILFLTKATAKLLGRPLDPLGSGLLAGGRGLPGDLSQAIVQGGKVEEVKDLGPIDQLLAEIEKVESVDLAEAQAAIVQQVQLGDREELIKQKDRLVKLAGHPNPEVRRTALWAIARTEDLGLAKVLFDAFDDADVDVMVEAQNGFCVLSRRPLGYGLPATPFQGLPEDATPEQRQKAVADWRAQLKEKWGQWYYKYRPYSQRDDLKETLFKTEKK
jgi:hypothetical protein